MSHATEDIFEDQTRVHLEGTVEPGSEAFQTLARASLHVFVVWEAASMLGSLEAMQGMGRDVALQPLTFPVDGAPGNTGSGSGSGHGDPDPNPEEKKKRLLGLSDARSRVSSTQDP